MTTEGGPGGGSGAGGLVLVVDDDPILREILAEWLGQAGYRPLTADDGDQAMAQCRSQRPDLVVTDMMMPNKDGIETVREFKARWPDLPVVAISSGIGGSDPEVILRAARAMGADAALSKPLNRAEFERLVGSLIAASPVRPAPAG